MNRTRNIELLCADTVNDVLNQAKNDLTNLECRNYSDQDNFFTDEYEDSLHKYTSIVTVGVNMVIARITGSAMVFTGS